MEVKATRSSSSSFDPPVCPSWSKTPQNARDPSCERRIGPTMLGLSMHVLLIASFARFKTLMATFKRQQHPDASKCSCQTTQAVKKALVTTSSLLWWTVNGFTVTTSLTFLLSSFNYSCSFSSSLSSCTRVDSTKEIG